MGSADASASSSAPKGSIASGSLRQRFGRLRADEGPEEDAEAREHESHDAEREEQESELHRPSTVAEPLVEHPSEVIRARSYA